MLFRRILTILSLALFFTGLNIGKAYAQAPTGGTTPGCRPQVWMCAQTTQLDDFRINLKATGLPSDTPIYVVCGVTTPEGWVYTTGSDTHDQTLCMGNKNYTSLSSGLPNPPLPYTLSVAGGNPVTAVEGNIDVTVRSVSTGNATNHTCMLAYVTDPIETAEPDRRANSLQYESLSIFARPAACTTVRQDPFGRVFDAQTLKPVSGVQTTILDSTKKTLVLPGVKNPVTTLSDGLFNFVVEAGSYFLKTPLAIATSVHENASLAYSNILASYDTAVTEKQGETKQVDIAVTGSSRSPVLELMEQGVMQMGRQTRVTGKASWPLTQIEVKQTETLSQAQADKFGYFELNIDNAKIGADTPLQIILTEVDLTTDPKTAKIGGDEETTEVDPIPTYLEGFAKDITGREIPFATVRVMLTSTDTLYFQTTADDKGFFSISPRSLPIISFYLEFTPPNSLSRQKVTIPQFSQSNREYLVNEDINLIAGTKAGVAVDPVLMVGGVPTTAVNPSTAPASQTKDSGNTVIFIIVILIMIILSALGIFFYWRKKRQSGETTSIDSTSNTNVV